MNQNLETSVKTNSQTNFADSNRRIVIADILRAFAVGAIMLLHSIEHFNFYRFPETTCKLLQFTDKAIWDSMFFMFGGKAYAIFALLFGLSFFIQRENRLKKGEDFRFRFAWRLVLLFLWGNLNAAFFTGEVLVLYSLVGFVMIFVAHLKSKTILIIAAILMLQPIEWGKLIYALSNPDYVMPTPLSSIYFQKAYPVLENGSFLETVKMNLYEGQLASITWAWSNGRFCQTASLFMLGYLMGRHNIFSKTDDNRRLFVHIVIVSLICFFPLNGLYNMIGGFVENKAVLTPLRLIFKSLASFAFMSILVSSITLFYYYCKGGSKLDKIAPYGRMSLTNYIMQSVVGSMLFYGWGFALYQYLGTTFSILLGVVLLILQFKFSLWWMSTHRQGPLEAIWHKLTWIGSK
ncbi:MAG: DUF418 domain-containing protein [Rikenellaceae bacterium]